MHKKTGNNKTDQKQVNSAFAQAGPYLNIAYFFIGSMATAYLFKIFLTDIGVIDFAVEQGVFNQIILFALLKFWQYGFAFIFIFYTVSLL